MSHPSILGRQPVFPSRHWWVQMISYSQTAQVALLWSSYVACFDPLLGALAKTKDRRLELYLEMKNDNWLEGHPIHPENNLCLNDSILLPATRKTEYVSMLSSKY